MRALARGRVPNSAFESLCACSSGRCALCMHVHIRECMGARARVRVRFFSGA